MRSRAPPPPPYYHHHHNPPSHFPAPPPFYQNHYYHFTHPPLFVSNQQFHLPPPRPTTSSFDGRSWEFAKTLPPATCERFTVLSYNILADCLANSHQEELYYHIPHHILNWEFRKRNIIFELGVWSADILCLQEVDRYQDLVEELKFLGYCGIWKRRTGNHEDGCAIFWRASRFKLVHEVHIEFNKLGLRDNVAQICIFESVDLNCNRWRSAFPASLGVSNKVVVCNIHVLFNPKRGDMKLGQVRVLLSRAHELSKNWNDAPVVLCGDFNSTPKSSLYNFISEQKLDVDELSRYLISGQVSAEIHPRPFTPNLWDQSTCRLTQSSSTIESEVRHNDSFLDIQKKNHSDRSSVIVPSLNRYTQPESSDSLLNVSVSSYIGNDGSNLSSFKPTEGWNGDNDAHKEKTTSTTNCLNESTRGPQNGGIYPGTDSPSIGREPFEVKEPRYDRSAWTSVEIEVATGNSTCTMMEHPIKLRSTYSEVEDCSCSRDSHGEPQVTSYHRKFIGTVDYIWRSEGLQTVRVLAPIPRNAMLWTPGFPTVKCGSDHIALVAELAFVKDANDKSAEIQ